MDDKILDLLLYCIPALVALGISFLFFKQFINSENRFRNLILRQSLDNNIIPLRIQAYERFALFLERISSYQLLKRVVPISQLTDDYKHLLISTIEQEFEHNLSQQIYISDQCWIIISAAKNSSIQTIKEISSKEIKTANDLRPVLLSTLSKSKVTTEMALDFLKKELSIFFK